MDHLEHALAARTAKVQQFAQIKDEHVGAVHQMVVRVGLDKQSMHFSMGRMRSQPTKSMPAVRLEVPPDIRRNIQNEQLKQLLEQCDPKGEGRISLKSMRSVLSENVAAEPSKRELGRAASTPHLSSSKPKMSMQEKLVAAFHEADVDNSGAISKRELFALLERVGIDQHSQRMKLFSVRTPSSPPPPGHIPYLCLVSHTAP